MVAALALALIVPAFVLLAGTSAGATSATLDLLDKTMGHLPSRRHFPADSLVDDRSGHLLADLHPDGETRIPVLLDRVAPMAVKATVDTEDRNFWHEGVVDPGRILSAAWDDLRHGAPLQGASTITQQLAKIAYLDASPTIARKLRELFVARHLEATHSKEQILQDYLNDIPYGHGAVGIQAAAHTYFNTDAAKLDLAQATMLAGLPDAPTQLDPLTHPRAAKERQMVVINSMVEVGDITAEQAEQAEAEQLKFADGTADNVDLQPAFVGQVTQAVVRELKLDPATAGLRIITTLNPALQQLAQRVIGQQLKALSGYQVTDGALVNIDPSTGDVLAYVGSGGPNAPGADIDMAAAPRQPGSTFKLFTYSAAIQDRKITMLTPVLDAPLNLPTGGGAHGVSPWVVHNYDWRYHGLMPAEMALGNSLNIPAVKVELLTGIPAIVRMARAMAVTTLNQPASTYTPSLTLGGYPIPLWEMAQAASVLANAGTLHPARFITSVMDGSGSELLPPAAPAKQVLDPGVAFVMNQILTNDANRLLEFGAHSALTLPSHVVAAKTGTTNDFRDNLTVGWTPKLVTATWVGNANDQPMRGTTGLTGAAPIWHAFMSSALAGKADDWPRAPADVHRAWFDGHSGYLLEGTSVRWIPELDTYSSSVAAWQPARSLHQPAKPVPAPALPKPALPLRGASLPLAAPQPVRRNH